MTQNKKNVMILIVLAALALVCGALLYLDPTGMRSCTTGHWSGSLRPVPASFSEIREK